MSAYSTVRTSIESRRTSATLNPSISRARVPSAPVGPHERHDSGNAQTKRPLTAAPAGDHAGKSYVIGRERAGTARSPIKSSFDAPADSRRRADDGRIWPSAQAKAAEPLQAHSAWNPQASLTPHTTAPLASRVSQPPLAAQAPQSLQPVPLNQLSLDDQEAAIIDDLLFVFMGFEGQYIRYTENYNPHEEKNRLTGPQFYILSGLDPSLRDLASSMLRMATHYIAVEAFVEVMSRQEYGAVNHALCAAIRKLLKDYLILIAQLEHQQLTNPSFTLHVLNLQTKPTSHTLLQLYLVAQEILKKNGLLEDDADDPLEDLDDVENILETLRQGGDLGVGSLTAKKTCKGGNVLGLITRRLAIMSGDPAARTLLTTLLRESSRPYMTMLNEWLHHGGIKDPHAEFLIKEQKSIRREGLEQNYTDEYWEKRYTIRDSDVPPQLEAVKDKVLLAGKYLNVVRECGGVDVSKGVRDVPTSFDDIRFLDNINGAYAHANASLLDLLLTTHALPARLRSLKHYFFLDRSDFFTYFLELGSSELKKPAKSANMGKLQSLLDIVLRQPGSVAAEDPFKEDVKVTMNETGLTNWLMSVVTVTGLDQDAVSAGTSTWLTPATQPASSSDDKDIIGYDALVLDYAVPFPLSLVISRVVLTRYQLLFRHLLSLRHLETVLVGSWTDHSKVLSWRHKSSNAKIELWKRKAWTLRARMLVFVQQLLYYCTAEVIEPSWQSLMSKLSAEEKGDAAGAAGGGSRPVKRTVDELMQDHIDFLATCLKECMLTNSKLLRINSKVMSTCTMFANYTASLARNLAAADPDLSSPSPALNDASTMSTGTKAATYDPTRLAKLEDILQKYEDNFTRHLKLLLDALNYLAATETVVFLGLCARLSAALEGTGKVPGGFAGVLGSEGYV